MAPHVHDTGEEFVIDYLFREDTVTKPASLEIGVYNDNTDALADGDDIGNITTEPTGASYSRQTASLDGSDFTNADSSGDWQTTVKELTFDVSDSSQTIDSYFVVVNFQADDTSDSSANDHLFWTANLNESPDLSLYDEIRINDVGLTT